MLVEVFFRATPWTSGSKSSQVFSQTAEERGSGGHTDLSSHCSQEGLTGHSLTLWPCLALLAHGPTTHPLPAQALSSMPPRCGSHVPTRRAHWTAPQEEVSKKS